MSDPYMFPLVTSQMPFFWEKILPWAEEFCQHSQGSYDPDYIKDKLSSGQMQCWLIMKGNDILAICLTEIRKTLIKECIIIVTTGEKMESWIHLLETLKKYAALMGCKKVIGIARPGWEKILKPMGFRKTHVQLEIDL